MDSFLFSIAKKVLVIDVFIQLRLLQVRSQVVQRAVYLARFAE
jgi:hypothetical protein